MTELLTAPARRFLRAVQPEPEGPLAEMEALAVERGFPIVGREVGVLLRLLTRLSEAERAFEFGSGFGYSAYWVAGGLPSGGSFVLVEEDEEELSMARSFLDRAGLVDRAIFEVGDAIEVIDRYEGPFDLVIFDHEDHRYVEAFDTVREKIPPGGLLIADNAMRAGELIDLDALCRLLERDETESIAGTDKEPSASPATRGIATYLDRIVADPAFETVVVPVGDGVAISQRLEEPDPF